ncbi:MAG TPA: pirin family protein [Ignavibacteria bacterium]|nr:pirin family protein [Ignavibacteria bacterium]HMR39606.1 pirin family protein [Ignavibacteria bacterium]
MEKVIHRAKDRGHANHGWLDAHHSFSFANYYNPEKTRFGLLRVLNDDVIQPGEGFGTHPHDNMEIVTIPLKGELAHKDSTGNKEVIHRNEVQIMSAGSGLTHSEFNNSNTDEVNLLQLWVFPKEKNIKPRYDQKEFDPSERINKIQTVVSPNDDKSLWINQDAYFSLTNPEKDNEVVYNINKNGNGVYVFVIGGKVEIDGDVLSGRDAMGIQNTDKVKLKAEENSEVLIIEVPLN